MLVALVAVAGGINTHWVLPQEEVYSVIGPRWADSGIHHGSGGRDPAELVSDTFIRNLVNDLLRASKMKNWKPLARYRWAPLWRFNSKLAAPGPFPRGYLVCPRSVGPFYRGLIRVDNRKIWNRVWKIEAASSRILQSVRKVLGHAAIERSYYYDPEHGYRPGVIVEDVIVIYPSMDGDGSIDSNSTPELRYVIHTACETLWRKGIPRPSPDQEWRMLATLFVPGGADDTCARGHCFIKEAVVKRILVSVLEALKQESWRPVARFLGVRAFDLQCLDAGVTRTITVPSSATDLVWQRLLAGGGDWRVLQAKELTPAQAYLETVGARAGRLHILSGTRGNDLLVFDLWDHSLPLIITGADCGRFVPGN